MLDAANVPIANFASVFAISVDVLFGNETLYSAVGQFGGSSADVSVNQLFDEQATLNRPVLGNYTLELSSSFNNVQPGNCTFVVSIGDPAAIRVFNTTNPVRVSLDDLEVVGSTIIF